MDQHRIGLSFSIDDDTKEVEAVYLRIRDGYAVETKELAEGNALVDYDENGKLLGVEILGRCSVTVLDEITVEESEEVRRQVREADLKGLLLV